MGIGDDQVYAPDTALSQPPQQGEPAVAVSAAASRDGQYTATEQDRCLPASAATRLKKKTRPGRVPSVVRWIDPSYLYSDLTRPQSRSSLDIGPQSQASAHRMRGIVEPPHVKLTVKQQTVPIGTVASAVTRM